MPTRCLWALLAVQKRQAGLQCRASAHTGRVAAWLSMTEDRLGVGEGTVIGPGFSPTPHLEPVSTGCCVVSNEDGPGVGRTEWAPGFSTHTLLYAPPTPFCWRAPKRVKATP